jgi:hypothetical protein
MVNVARLCSLVRCSDNEAVRWLSDAAQTSRDPPVVDNWASRRPWLRQMNSAIVICGEYGRAVVEGRTIPGRPHRREGGGWSSMCSRKNFIRFNVPYSSHRSLYNVLRLRPSHPAFLFVLSLSCPPFPLPKANPPLLFRTRPKVTSKCPPMAPTLALHPTPGVMSPSTE